MFIIKENSVFVNRELQFDFFLVLYIVRELYSCRDFPAKSNTMGYLRGEYNEIS